MGDGTRTLDELATPCLILDAARMQRNIDRLRAHLGQLGVTLRPHLKTAKSLPVARLMMESDAGPATVSTLKEAALFAEAGVTDIIYAVGISPDKLDHVLTIRAAQGADLAVVLDSVEQAEMVAEVSRLVGTTLPALIEIDSDGHRAGVDPRDRETLLAIARALTDGGELRGVLTHAGGSYGARGEAALRAFAEQERAAVVDAATLLRETGFACPVVSVGSTPTAHAAAHLDGVTEVRAGVYVFSDLVIAGIGSQSIDDIAISVLGTVIGHQRDKGWILVDAGWMAMSRDRGTSAQAVDQGYGLVCDAEGRVYGDLIMIDANQEHGILAVRPGSDAALPDLPVGARVRILPNHACATGAQHDRYHVVRGTSRVVEAEWPRFGGW
jgi:D-serine deaminase-like pyridoxal phosphate-dependent protein